MKGVSTIGVDIAKKVFQVHGVDRSGGVVVRRAVGRSQMLTWFAKLPPCTRRLEAAKAVEMTLRSDNAFALTTSPQPKQKMQPRAADREKGDTNGQPRLTHPFKRTRRAGPLALARVKHA